MRLFRFLAYSFAFLLGAAFAFRGANTFPAPPPRQYKPVYASKPDAPVCAVDAPVLNDEVQKGKTLFMANCGACHNRNMVDAMTGPALAGVRERWADYPTEDFYNWIRNSQAMIENGHPEAEKLWREWKPNIMNSFPNLSDAEIDAILAYVDAVSVNW